MQQSPERTSITRRQLTVDEIVLVARDAEKEASESETAQPNSLAAKGETMDTRDIRMESAEAGTEASQSQPTDNVSADGYLTGLKLAAVLASITMAAFLMILDLSVVVTVSHTFPKNGNEIANYFHQDSHPLYSRHWLVWFGISLSQVSFALPIH